MPASEVYDEAGILTITPGSTNPQITERGMKDLSLIHICIPTIGITAEIRLGNSRYQMINTTFTGIHSRNTQKEQVEMCIRDRP